MTRETQNVLMLLLGLGTVVMVVKGTYVHYVRPSLMPWLIVAAAVLIALAVISIVRDIRAGARHSDAGASHRDGVQEPHRHRSWLLWLLLVPVAATAFVIPPPLGAHGATRTVAAASEPHRRAFPPLPPGQAPAVSLPEVMMRAAADSAGTLNDRLITVTGFTMKSNGGADLGRVVIVCCAADAQLARLHLSGPGAAAAANYPDDTWLQVMGTVNPGSSTAATNFVPTMTVADVTKIDRPANTYAY
jgi:uncharacterized repeat protein (TIGR03943 family)